MAWFEYVMWMGVFFLLGAVPFSYLLGRLFLHEDIRLQGDGNPGAANVFRTGHRLLGILAMVLDFAKGFIVLYVWLERWDHPATGVILTATAPVLGHAFSPFLKFKGGKAIAVTFGVWSALTTWVGPMWLGGMLVLFSFVWRLNTDGWKVQAALITLVIPLALLNAPWYFYGIIVCHGAISAYKHRQDLRVRPQIEWVWRRQP